MSIKGMEIGKSGSHTDRHGYKGLSWGVNGSVRPTTKDYRSGWDLAFGNKSTDTKGGDEDEHTDSERD